MYHSDGAGLDTVGKGRVLNIGSKSKLVDNNPYRYSDPRYMVKVEVKVG